MAQKQKQKLTLRPFPLDEPPTASSSDSDELDQHRRTYQQHFEEEEELSSGEEQEEASSASGEEEDQAPPSPISKNPLANPSSSESETESGSEHERTSAKVKPLASKPMDKAQKPNPHPSPAPIKSTSKRPAENHNAHVTDPKRAKKKSGDSSSSAAAASDDEMEEDGKKSGDQSKKARLWSEEDELAVLTGFVEYASKAGQDPLKLANATAFYDFMKKSLHVDVSCNQLKDKVRRLKKKYETHAGKMVNGEYPKFLKQHDQKAFELSKKVWGGEQCAGGANVPVEIPKCNGNAAKSPKIKETSCKNVASAKKPKPETKPELVSVELNESEKMQIDPKPDGGDANLFLGELSRFKESVSICELAADDIKKGLDLIEESKRAELRAKWKKLQHAEMELFANRFELIGEQSKLMVEALRSSNH